MYVHTFTAHVTVWNHLVAFPLAKLAHRLFGDAALLWCLDNLFEGETWLRLSTKELK